MDTRKKTLFAVFGTRPDAIKLAPLIKALERDVSFDLKLCVTAQHREMLDSVLEEFDIRPQFDLSIMKAEQTLDYLTGEVLGTVGELIDLSKPDALIVQGDTTTAFSSALAAFYRKVPIAHIEAGLRSGSISSPFPEEFNRRCISAMASVHFAPTEAAGRMLASEGIPKERIFTVGNTAIDTLLMTKDATVDYKIEKFIASRPYLLITVHRREHSEDELDEIFEGIKNLLLDNGEVCAVYPLHKNPRVANKAREKLGSVKNILLCEPLSTHGFHALMRSARILLTDSGGIQEEATYLGKPTLVLRSNTERGEGVLAGALKVIGTSGDDIYKAATLLLYDRREYEKMACPSLVYGNGHASERIVNILKTL